MGDVRYYVDAEGRYLGAFDVTPDAGVEVPFAPDDARQIWSGQTWQSVQVFQPIDPVPFWNAAFDLFGLKDTDVLAAIADDDQRYLARKAIEGRRTYVRDDPWVADLATLKGYPPEQMDSLWIYVQENYK